MPTKKITIETIQDWLYEHNTNTKIISKEYKNNKADIEMICDCGNYFISNWNRMSNTGKCQCNECGEKIRTKIKTNIDDISLELQNFGYTIIDNNFNNIKNIKVIDNDGYKYVVNVFNIRKNEKPMKFSASNIFFEENLKNYITKNSIDVKIININRQGTSSSRWKITMKCSCGNIFETTVDSFFDQDVYRCRKCSKSKSLLEVIVAKYLDSIGVEYIEQYCFDDCKNIRKLRYDFFLPQYNVVIEVNGQQHYYEQKDFNLTLKEQIDRDKYKQKYCEEKNIKYVAIPFWYIKNNGEKQKYKETINKILE